MTLRLLILALLVFCSATYGQAYNPVIDVQHYFFSLGVNDTNDRITGNAVISLTFQHPAHSFFLDLASSVTADDIESLMAHEIAHQWFGDAVTETQWQHLWLNEGFATYDALLSGEQVWYRHPESGPAGRQDQSHRI